MTQFISIRYLLGLLLNKWWLIGSITLISATAGYFFSLTQSPVYQATVILAVGKAEETTIQHRHTIHAAQLLALTYADLARRRPVLEPVAAQLDAVSDWRALSQRIHSRPIYETNRFAVSVQAHSAPTAITWADAVANQLVTISPQAYQDQIPSPQQQYIVNRLTTLQQQLDAGQVQAAKIAANQARATSGEDIQFYDQQLRGLEAQLIRWQQNQTYLQNILQPGYLSNTLWVVEPAQNNTQRLFPRTQINTGVATLLGLALGIGLTLALTLTHTKVERASTIEEDFGLRYLGSIPLVSQAEPPFEPYRRLRTMLQYATIDQATRLILVTSPLPAEGKSTTAANLAIVMAQAGLSTILVDANLRRPRLHHHFQTPVQGGLARLLVDPTQSLANHLTQTRVANLNLLLTEPMAYTAEYLNSPRMTGILAELRGQANLIIIDSPPVLSVADATVLAARVDCTLLVIETKATPKQALQQTCLQLKRSGTSLVGAILNKDNK